MENEIQFSFTWKASMFGGRKLVEYSTIFLKMVTMKYCFTMEKERRGEIMEKREKKKVGEASTVARERWLINSSHSFFNSGGGKHVLLSYWVKCCLPI